MNLETGQQGNEILSEFDKNPSKLRLLFKGGSPSAVNPRHRDGVQEHLGFRSAFIAKLFFSHRHAGASHGPIKTLSLCMK